MNTLTITLLLQCQQHIPEIAALKYKEFGYLVPSKTVEDFILGMHSHFNESTLPITYVLREGDSFAGTISLRAWDLDTHKHLFPWIGSVLVHPSKRNQGLGSLLVNYAEQKAYEMGYETLYLFTPDKEAFYQKLGWKTLEQTTFNEIPVAIMQKHLGLLKNDSKRIQ